MSALKLLLFLPLVHTTSGSERRSAYGCEGTQVHLECEEGTYISPVRANYGRFDAGICNPEGNKVWSTRCIQPTTLRRVNSVCQGKRSCSMDVTSSEFGDPCPHTYKYLEVHYTCQTEVRQTQQLVNLPPWLLKMSATTAKPYSSTTSTTTSTTTTEVPTVEEEEMDLLPDLVEEDVLVPVVENILEFDERIREEADQLDHYSREVFVNLPLVEPEIENLEVGEERTILIATLVSIICCTLILFVAAIVYTRMKRTKNSPAKEMQVSSTINTIKFNDFKTNHSNIDCSHYEYDSVSSGSSTVSSIYTTGPNLSTVGSVYTTLPNGQTAIIIPLGANPNYLGQILSLEQQSRSQPLLLPTHRIDQENIYIDIDQNQGGQYVR